ncbi:hypothetical protein PQX77_022175 [Marasmius sp. AFHP31]|nr:hypothetical protein PQX77_022175 [Marasmius sp. AFHP31]
MAKGKKRQVFALEEDFSVVTSPNKRTRKTQLLDDRGVAVSQWTSRSPKKPLPFRSKSSQPRPDPPPGPSKTPTQDDKGEGEVVKDAEDLLAEERTRRMKLLGEYSDKMDQAARILLDQEYDATIGTPCPCKQGRVRNVRCRECDSFPALCAECWVDAHKHNSLHWAHVWNESGYFVKHDISTLSEGRSIPLGHNGETCPRPGKSQLFTIVDVNGVHATRVSFCGCKESEGCDKWTKLLTSDLFPSTVLEPQSAFTFRALHQYNILSLQAKITAYDYMKSVRRMTDNVFTGNVPDLYKQFVIVVRIWGLLMAERRAGKMHGTIEKSAQNLIVECPACPTAGLNMESGWSATPSDLRHLHQTRLTLDGNYQANHFAKKHDPNDVSLWAGKGYFPVASVYNAHCGSKEASSEEKSVCGHLKVINKQNKVKFKNMDISGIVNCQCCHIFIRSSSNLKCGETWVSVDECLSRGVSQRSIEENGVVGQLVVGFDAMCSYCKKIPARWMKNHPEIVHLARQMRWVIPVCHCRNHIASCEPLFLYVYKEGIGEFKAETAELAWDYLNAIGPAIRQMTLGAREDALNCHIGDWNWRKLVGIARQLFNEIIRLKDAHIKKRAYFSGLWAIYGSKATEWAKEDRSPKVDSRRKLAVKSVYMHDEDEKAPNLKSLVNWMKRSSEGFETPSGTRKVGAIARFLEEGMALALAHAQSNSDLSSRRNQLAERLKRFRKKQGNLMDSDAAARFRGSLPCHPEEEPLCLPADFDEDERLSFKLAAMAQKQALLVNSKLFELTKTLRRDVILLTAAYDRKNKHDRGQQPNTRAMVQVNTLRSNRDEHLKDYNFFRAMLARLLVLEPEEWPVLTVTDTYRKSTEQRRVPGSSGTLEGVLWSNLGKSTTLPDGDGDVVPEELDLEHEPELNADVFFFGTRMTKMKGHGPPKNNKSKIGIARTEPAKEKVIEEDEDFESDPPTKDGWIWSGKALKEMTETEIEQWENTSDRVQFFRAEAEYERALEELEYKHGCFGNTIRYFFAKRDVWKSCLGKGLGAGFEAYAREHADMFQALRLDAEAKFRICGITTLIDESNGKTLAERVIKFRKAEEEYFPRNRNANRPPFKDPTVHSSGFQDTREGAEEEG